MASLITRRTPATLLHSIRPSPRISISLSLPTRSLTTTAIQRLSAKPQSTTTPRLSPTTPLTTITPPKRWNSSSPSDKPPVFKQWGFEDITTTLPSTKPSSPPSTPQKSLILIDVREPAELTSTGIIPSAVSVPLASQPDALFLTPDEFETRFGFPKPGVAEGEAGTDIVFYCKAGVRARAAAQLAVQAGYEVDRVGVYDGSWLDWAARGGRVERWEGDDF
ncbi:Rhodanese-like protein [Aspergillus ellipticus CBS 707.79]|uniref:Rhodanese-like protein n=1 Tax=Aspergillus ellipticus CBS 707.79 TaxID=1448320 RepID=A0A319DRE8_9EURO|nr:Rhodanese-like protein [Aspergillus ellipticus CBS 707.79]